MRTQAPSSSSQPLPRSRGAALAATALAALCGCGADDGLQAAGAPADAPYAAAAAPRPVVTRCQVSQVAFLPSGRLAYAERSDADSCRRSSSLPTQSLVIGPPGQPKTSSFDEAITAFDVSRDGSRIAVINAQGFRLLDGAGAPVAPWQRPPRLANRFPPQYDWLDAVRVSPSGRRVLLHGVNSPGWFVYDAVRGDLIQVAWERPATGGSASSVAFASDDAVLIARTDRNNASDATASSLSLYSIGAVGAPLSLPAVPRWRVDAPRTLYPQHGYVVSPFGNIEVSPDGATFAATGGAQDGSPPRTPELRRLSDGGLLRSLAAPVPPALRERQISFSGDGRRVAIAASPRLHVFNTATGAGLLQRTASFAGVALFPASAQLATARLIDVRSQALAPSITFDPAQ